MLEVLPLVDEGLGNRSYVVDLGDGSAAVVDPERDPVPYLQAAGERGLAVRFAVETHLHADFISGARELAAAGARLFAPAASGLVYDHEGLRNGEEIDLGGLTLRAVATPGHTPEHLAYVLLDGSQPLALFSGGALIPGGVARPDLISPDQTQPLAREAYRSIHDRLLILPDDLPVYPTHGGGSFCAAGAGERPVNTLGDERGANPLLQSQDEDTFVACLLGGLGSFPSYFLHLREVNRRGPTLYGTEPPTLRPLAPPEMAEAIAEGMTVVDARPIDRFAAGHIPGSVSIELRDQFATWLGWVVDFDQQVVFVLDDDQDEHDLVAQALKVGYEHLAGRLHVGIKAWEANDPPVATIPLLVASELKSEHRLLDVRQRREWQAGHVTGAVHRELGTLAAGASDLAGPLVVHCEHGQRAMTGASLLRRFGLTEVLATTAGPGEITHLQAKHR